MLEFAKENPGAVTFIAVFALLILDNIASNVCEAFASRPENSPPETSESARTPQCR